jgi:amidophosphoribosyltransferase
MAGIVAIYNLEEKKTNIVYLLAHSMRTLQHRGKAYWKMMVGQRSAAKEGSLPPDQEVAKIARQKKLYGNSGVGYLSKRTPQFDSMNVIHSALDGFFVDTEKLHLHPCIGAASHTDSLHKIYYIFTHLLIQRKAPQIAAEFLDRHIRGNMIIELADGIYAYRNSSGFKPLVVGYNRTKSLFIIASENSLRISLSKMRFRDINSGSLIKLSASGLEVIASLPRSRLMIDPFEFIRESHVNSTINNKSIYSIRKQIGKVQADHLGRELSIDYAFAEPDYTRPMTLGFSAQYQKYSPDFETSEGIIKDRYDDSDNMIDFSEQVSKNKLLSTGKSLKFIIQNLVKNKKVATVQGTIQTGSTTKETIYYLRQAGATSIYVIISYVPTVDGRQVGLYSQNRELIANKHVGKVSSINELNELIARQLKVDAVYYNSPSMLADGIGLSERNLWFPEWVRFLDYTK